MITIDNITTQQNIRLQIEPLESLLLDDDLQGGGAEDVQTDDVDGGRAKTYAFDALHGGVADFGKAGHRLTLVRASSNSRYIIPVALSNIGNGQVDVSFSLPFKVVLGEYRYTLHNMGGMLSQGVMRVTDKLYNEKIKTIYG